MELPKRKPNRLVNYDYSEPGYYFITVCTLDGRPHFWRPCSVGADIIRPENLPLSALGMMVDEAVRMIPCYYPTFRVEKYVVMPNHIHLLLRILETDGRMLSAPTEGNGRVFHNIMDGHGQAVSSEGKTISVVVGQMKRVVSKQAGFPLWQKGFHDHVIRCEADYLRIWNYVDTNPAKWRDDCYFEEAHLS